MSYYTTEIKSVGAGYAVDVQGKNLKFIGNLPCQAGDTVWTDGKVIFGNVTNRGTPIFDDVPQGIPVVADVIKDTAASGYFNLNGTFRSKTISAESWITNDKNKCERGKDIFDEDKVIDAEISNDGALYLVTEGFYTKRTDKSYTNRLSRMYHHYIRGAIVAYSSIARIDHYDGETVRLGTGASLNKADIEDIPVEIFKGSEKVTEISLKTFADLAADKSLKARDKIMELSEDISGAVNFFNLDTPPDSFVAVSFARVLAFKIDRQGNWDAIIHATAFGYCFPYLSLDSSVLYHTFNEYYGASTSYSSDLATCCDNLEYDIFQSGCYPFLNVTKYPSYTSGSYEQYIEAKISYYIPRVRFKHYEWYVVQFGAAMEFHVHNGKIVTTIVEHSFGGNEVEIINSWNEERMTRTNTDSEPDIYSVLDYHKDFFQIEDDFTERDWKFPIADGFYLRGTGYNPKKIVDGSETLNLDVPPFYRGELAINTPPFSCSVARDTIAVSLDQQGIYLNELLNAYIYMPNGNFSHYRNGELQENNWTTPTTFGTLQLGNVDEIFHKTAEKTKWGDSTQGFYRLSPSFTDLRGNKYLFGNHGGELYLKDADGWQQVGRGLKNFRLRKMTNVNKARR